MSYARRIAYNTIVQLIGRVLTTFISLITVSLLNSKLHAVGWGEYTAVINYVGLFGVLADLGINTLYLREISRAPEKTDEITAHFFGFRLVTAILVFAIAPAASLLLPTFHPYALPILLASVAQFVLIANQIFVSVFQERLHMERAMITDLAGRVVILISLLIVLKVVPDGSRLIAVFIIVTAGNLINLLLSYVLSRKFFTPKLRFLPRTWPLLFWQVLPLGALSVLSTIHFKADSFILTTYRPLVEVGIYGNAYKVVEILLTLPSMFIGSIFPNLNQAIMRRDPEFTTFIQKAFDLILFAVAPLILIIVVCAPLIIGMLTRDNVSQAAWALRVLTLAMVPWFMGNLMGNILLAADQQKKLSIIQLIAVIINISTNLLFIPKYGFHAAAITTVISESIGTLSSSWLVYHSLKFHPNLRLLRTMLPTLIIIAGLLWVVNQSVSLSAFMTKVNAYSRPEELAVLAVSGGVLLAVYLLPFFLFGQLPSVLQSRLPGLRAMLLRRPLKD